MEQQAAAFAFFLFCEAAKAFSFFWNVVMAIVFLLLLFSEVSVYHEGASFYHEEASFYHEEVSSYHGEAFFYLVKEFVCLEKEIFCLEKEFFCLLRTVISIFPCSKRFLSHSYHIKLANCYEFDTLNNIVKIIVPAISSTKTKAEFYNV